eukprot:981235-Amorphochlora_amoeboformis.AAC.1
MELKARKVRLLEYLFARWIGVRFRPCCDKEERERGREREREREREKERRTWGEKKSILNLE